MPSPAAVIFDNDGLLLDTESVWTRAEADLFERRGLEFTPAHKLELDRLRGALEAWMKHTRDPLLESFQKRDDASVGEAYVRKTEQESAARGKRNAGRRQGARAADNDGGD